MSAENMDDLFGRSGPRPTVATDCVVLTVHDKKVWILLVERGHEPYKGKWALPGGFMEWHESCEHSAARELQEETTLQDVRLDLLGVFSEPDRDPRGTVVSVIYLGLIPFSKSHAEGHDDAAKAEWFPLDAHPELAFDHPDAVVAARKFLQAKEQDLAWFAPLLPEEFTLWELKTVLETVFGKTYDKRNFQRMVLQKHLLKPLEKYRHQKGRKPALLYTFSS